MDTSKKQVTALICNSNMFVPYVLTIAIHHPEKRYLIMVDIDNIEHFFKEIKVPNADILRYKHATSRFGFFRASRKLLTQVSKYDISELIFFHTEFGGIINWFIENISKKTKIYFCKVFNPQSFPQAHGIKAVYYGFNDYIMNGTPMDILYRPSGFMPSLPKRYYKKVGAEQVDIQVDHKIIKQVISEHLGKIEYDAKVVFLTGSTVATGFVEKDEYIKKTDALIDAIGEQNCVAKCHPRFNDVFSKELELQSIPSYIPGNMVIGCYDVFISNNSTMLVEAAIAEKKAISLIDYYNLTDINKNKQIKSFYSDRLEGRGVIYYPKSIEEVLKIIK